MGRRRIDPNALVGEKRVGRHGEQKRRWDADNRHPCSEDGCENLVEHRRTRCRSCYVADQHESRDVRRREIQRLWHDGETLREIAVALDTTVNSLGATMCGMRADGWDVPYRPGYPR
jgi:hypothetical protein